MNQDAMPVPTITETLTERGNEVTLKALAAGADHDDGTRYLLIGDAACLERLNAAIGLTLFPFTNYTAEGRWFVADPRANPLPSGLEPGAPAAARAAVEWLREGAGALSPR